MSTIEIRSPLPGTFYRKPAPDAPVFKADGDGVAAGDVIGLIEVMKSFHEIKADGAGAAIRFLADDGDAVMAGQALAEMEA
jgi:biotin carboxyl carrier protein